MDNFVIETQKKLKKLLYENGSVLYSSYNTLKEGDLYIVGLNPGGSDGYTINQSLESLTSYRENAYLDEIWNTEKKHYEKGKHPLQKNIKSLIEYLGYDLREICSSNLIFKRSVNAGELTYLEEAGLCWPVHQHILKIVRPKVLIVFGISSISPFDYLKNKYFQNGGNESNIDSYKSGHSTWKVYSFNMNLENEERLIIAVPHLSIYHIEYHLDVLNWIKNLVDNKLEKS